MLQEILWLDGGDTITRGTGTQNQYNYVTPYSTKYYNYTPCYTPGYKLVNPWLRGISLAVIHNMNQNPICCCLQTCSFVYKFTDLVFR